LKAELTQAQRFNLFKWPLILGSFFLVSIAKADFGNLFILCKNEKNVRTLRVEIASDNKCTAFYTKSGVDSNIGNSSSSSGCEEFVLRVRKKLEEASWKCREVKEARTSNIVKPTE
jgi:hypothetical protein